MIRRLVPFLVLTCFLSASVTAQKNLGPGSAGAGGITPTLSASQPWMGNPNWGIGIDGGVGGATGLLAISPNAVNVNLGVPVYVDLTTVLQPLIPFTLSGSPGAPGTGSFFLPLSLAGANAPALAGLSFTFQAGIFDPTVGVAVTNGLTASLTMPPQVFVGTSVGGSSDPYRIADPVAGNITVSSGASATNNVNGAVYTDFGRTLYALSGFGTLSKTDATLATPAWTSVTTFVSAGGVAEGNLQYDACRNLMWVFADAGNGSEFHAIDVDPNSATLDQILYSTTNVGTNLVGTWELSPDGTRLCLPSLLGGSIRVWDTDPASPGFLANVDLWQPPIPVPLPSSMIPTSAAGSLWVNNDIEWSDDGQEIFVLRQGTGPTPGEIAVYSFALQRWIDFDPNTPAVDNIGQFASPPITFGSAPVSLSVGPNEDWLFVSGFGGPGWAGRVDLPLAVGATNYTPLGGIDLTNAWRSSVNPDGDTIALTSGSGSFSLRLIDPLTLTELIALPIGVSSTSNIVWR